MKRFRLFRTTIALLLSCVTVNAGSSPDAQRIATKAKERMEQAQKDLASFRTTTIEERKAFAVKLQAAYSALHKARIQEKLFQKELAELTHNRDEFRRDEASYRYKCRILLRQLQTVGDCVLPKDKSADEIADMILSNLQPRLANLAESRNVSLSQMQVITRQGTKASVPVLKVGGVVAYACGNEEDFCGLLKQMDNGDLRITGMLPDAAGHKALVAVNNGNAFAFPADVTDSLSSREAATRQTWANWLSAGGIFVYPILICGLLGCLLIIERILYLCRTHMPAGELSKIRITLNKATGNSSGETFSTAFPQQRIAKTGLLSFSESTEERDSRMEAALLSEAPRLNRSLSLLAALAGVAPLLGLLGTVFGMIRTFGDISNFGTGNSQILSGGISEALITTQLGLMVAVPLLLGHAWLNRSIERREILLEQWAMEVLHIIAGKREQK